MLENGKISNNQFTILIIIFLLGISGLILPSIIAEQAGRDAWLSIMIAVGIGVATNKIYSNLAARYPKLTLVEYSEKILGKWLGKGISILFFVYFVILTSGLLRLTVDLILTHILPETPIQAIEFLFMIIIIMAIRLGLEPFARTAEMLIPYVIMFILILTVLLLDEIKLENLLPFLENGIKPILKGSYRVLGIPFLDLVVFLMIAPYVTKPEKFGKNMFFATVFVGGILSLITFLSISILGPESTVRLNFPAYVLAQKVEVGNFLERIEILSGGLLFISLFVKVTICFYAMALSLAQTFELKSYKPLTYPLGLLMMFLSIFLFPNIIYFRKMLVDTWPPIVLIYGLVFPLFLITVDMIKKKFSPKGENQSVEN